MNERYTYLLVNLSSVIIPVIFSFHKKYGIDKRRNSHFGLALILPALFFLVWDLLFTNAGIWSFNKSKVLGIYFFGLPLEEMMFFICIPYACLFTYNAIRNNTRWKFSDDSVDFLVPFFITAFTFIAVMNAGKWYTSVTFMLASFLLAYCRYILNAKWLGRMFLTFSFILLPFFITNGILTGSFIDNPVVMYHHQHNLNIRMFTIPLEDMFYALSMMIMSVMVYENRLRKDEEHATYISV